MPVALTSVTKRSPQLPGIGRAVAKQSADQGGSLKSGPSQRA